MKQIDRIKPLIRAIKYGFLNQQGKFALKLASLSGERKVQNIPPPAYIIGCGRSGTTILGELLSQHPEITYLFEPYHLWFNVDADTDALNLYHLGSARLLMDQDMASTESKIRFQRLITSQKKSATPLLIEKTPLNAMRIGYLEELSPEAKYVHIIRDGWEVASSIDRLATGNTYKIAGKPDLNQWWGVDYCKWNILKEDGIKAGYYADEVGLLTDNLSKGAYEWLVSLKEIDQWRDILGDRLLEITYNQFTEQPEATLSQICQFLALEQPDTWLDQAVAKIRKSKTTAQQQINLPPKMARDFNYYQNKYSFPHLAVSV